MWTSQTSSTEEPPLARAVMVLSVQVQRTRPRIESNSGFMFEQTRQGITENVSPAPRKHQLYYDQENSMSDSSSSNVTRAPISEIFTLKSLPQKQPWTELTGGLWRIGGGQGFLLGLGKAIQSKWQPLGFLALKHLWDPGGLKI